MVRTAERKPRVGTVYIVFVLSSLAIFVASLALVSLWVVARFGLDGLQDPGTIRAQAITTSTMIASVALISTLLGGCALLAAHFSKQPWRERLGLSKQPWTPGELTLVLLGAPAIGTVLETLVGLAGIEISGALEAIAQAMQQAHGFEIPLLVVVIGFGPAIGEELMCRGYFQTRLVERHGAVAGILVSAFLFGLYHRDPLQSPLAGLLGIYLGVVAYRMGSIVFAILAHAFNNIVSVFALLALPDGVSGSTQLIMGGVSLVIAVLAVRVVMQKVPPAHMSSASSAAS